MGRVSVVRIGGPPSMAAPKPSSTRPSRSVETFTSPFPPRGKNPVAQTESSRLFERHREDPAVAKPDHLCADGTTATSADLAKVANGRRGPARFYDQADQFDHLTFGTHRLNPVQGRGVIAQINFGNCAHIAQHSRQSVDQAAADLFELGVDRCVDYALRGMNDQCSRSAVRIRLDFHPRRVTAGQCGGDRGGKPWIHRDRVRLGTRQALKGNASQRRQSAFVHSQLPVKNALRNQ